MKRGFVSVLGAAIALSMSQMAGAATPLRLDYAINPLGGGVYHYDFTLTLDNHDGSWAPGQGWGWLIFGDQQSTASNLTGFAMDSGVFPVGPWTSLTASGGFHNGPTFNDISQPWTPTSVGSSLHWAGTSTANIPDQQLLFSTIAFNVGGASPANFEPGHLSSVPEPASLTALGLGALAFVRRRRKIA